MTGFPAEAFDVVVIGAGHAGIEAALAAARLGMKTACFIPIKANSERVPGKNFRLVEPPLPLSGRMKRDRKDNFNPACPDPTAVNPFHLTGEHCAITAPVVVFAPVYSPRDRISVQPQRTSLHNRRRSVPAVGAVLLLCFIQRLPAAHTAGLPDVDKLFPAVPADTLF